MLRARFLTALLTAAALAITGAACSKKPDATAPPASQSNAGADATATPDAAASPGDAATAPAVKPMPAQLPDVLARVNGEAISKAEFEQAVQTVVQRTGGPVPAERRDQVYRGLLDQLISVTLLRQEVAARHVTVPDADVDTHVNALKQRFATEDAFQQALAAQHATLDKLREDQREELQISKLLDLEIKDKVTASPDQVAAFYRKNPDRFKEGERVRVSQILLAVPQKPDPAVKAATRARAEDLLKQVKAGRDFAALAKEFSQDPGSAPNGGDLGFLQSGQMVGPVNDVAFKLAPGRVSGVVESQLGFHIIKVVAKKPSRIVPLDEVKDRLKQDLEKTNKIRVMSAFVASLRAKGKVEILV